MGPIITLPTPESPAAGVSGFVFPMHARQAPFGLILFGIEPGASIDAHSHAVHEYWFITAGQGPLRYDGETYTVQQGDLLYFEPHKRHEIINDGDQRLEVVSVDWA